MVVIKALKSHSRQDVVYQQFVIIIDWQVMLLGCIDMWVNMVVTQDMNVLVCRSVLVKLTSQHIKTPSD